MRTRHSYRGQSIMYGRFLVRCPHLRPNQSAWWFRLVWLGVFLSKASTKHGRNASPLPWEVNSATTTCVSFYIPHTTATLAPYRRAKGFVDLHVGDETSCLPVVIGRVRFPQQQTHHNAACHQNRQSCYQRSGVCVRVCACVCVSACARA